MTTTTDTKRSDPELETTEEDLMAFVDRAVGDVGAVLNGAMVVIGDRLGLYRAMAGRGPVTPTELAAAHRHRRALRARVAVGPGGDRLRVPRGRRPVPPARRAGDRRSPTRPAPPASSAPSSWRWPRSRPPTASPTPSARATACRWGDHHHDVLRGLRAVLPPRVPEQPRRRLAPRTRRRRGRPRRRAPGWPTSAAATALRPWRWRRRSRTSTFTGFDGHPASIEAARQRAADAGLCDRVRFEVAPAKEFDRAARPGLLLRLPARHGRPGRRTAQRALDPGRRGHDHARRAHGRRHESSDNINPVGAAYYAFSTLLCTPELAVPGGGGRPRCPGGRARLARRRRRGRHHPGAAAWPSRRSTWSSNCGRDGGPRPEPPPPYDQP